LFNLLVKCGLSCEKIKQSYGGSYGGGGIGYTQYAEVKYKEVTNEELMAKITAILTKYDSKSKFVIAVPTKGKFEILVNHDGIIFNADLDLLSDKDLEATVLVGLFHTQQGNLYKAFKRLIKFIMGKTYFRNLLFGIGDVKDTNDLGF
jgi:hypothetical protein